MTASAGRGPPRAEVQGRRVAPGQGGEGFTYTVVVLPVAAPVPAASAARAGERRAAARVRARLQEGEIARHGQPVAHCRIRDRSRGGARLLLDEPRPLPRRFLLTDAANRARFWADVVWQHGRDAGVRLVPA